MLAYCATILLCLAKNRVLRDSLSLDNAPRPVLDRALAFWLVCKACVRHALLNLIIGPRLRHRRAFNDLLTGQFNNPVRVVAFNTSEGWSRDISEDVAREVLRRVKEGGRPLAASSRQFVEAFVDGGELARAESGLA